MDKEPSGETPPVNRIFVNGRPPGVSDEVWQQMAADIIETAATAYVENQRQHMLAGDEKSLRQVDTIYSGHIHPDAQDPEYLAEVTAGVARGEQQWLFIAIGLRALQLIRESNPYQ